MSKTRDCRECLYFPGIDEWCYKSGVTITKYVADKGGCYEFEELKGGGAKRYEVLVSRDMTCIGCQYFVEEEPYSNISMHPYCKALDQYVMCLKVGEGEGYKGTNQLPIKLARCINEILGPVTIEKE